MALVLYTQPRCAYCEVIQTYLKEESHEYQIVDISKDKSGMDFIKNKGHRTVPQLYWNSTWVNKDTNTASLSPTSLSNLITEAIDNERAAGFVA